MLIDIVFLRNITWEDSQLIASTFFSDVIGKEKSVFLMEKLNLACYHKVRKRIRREKTYGFMETNL